MRPLCFILILAITFLSLSARAEAQITTTLESVNAYGQLGDDESSTPGYGGTFSANLQLLVFTSRASNLVPNDTNNDWDVFVRDRVNHTVSRVSVTSSGQESHTYAYASGISADGRYVTFLAKASFPSPNSSRTAVFVHDLVTGSTTRISDDHGSATGGCLSYDGRYIAFSSSSNQLVPGDTNGTDDAFVYDQVNQTMTRVSVDSSGGEGDAYSFGACISLNGRFVTFGSTSTNLVPNDTNLRSDIFVHDLQTAETTRVSVTSDGAQANDNSYPTTISLDGRFVAFESDASNFFGGDDHGPDVFVHDRVTGKTILASTSSSGQRGNDSSFGGSLSQDGRFVAFDSYASNFISGDTNHAIDSFVHDFETGETHCVSINLSGVTSYFGGAGARMSPDGRYAVFSSYSSDLVPGDTNNHADVFLRGAPLVLEASPATVAAGDTITLTTTFGEPAHPTSLWVTSISDTPTFLLVITGSFDPTGMWTLSGTVPSGLGLTTIDFRTLAIGLPGQIVSSNDASVVFQ
ncbi:MAG: hypothetical protein U1E76_02680 [Planctomycetota bacterium]